VIDDHAHPFALEYAPLPLAEVSLDVRDSPADRARRAQLAGSRLTVELLGVRLARYLGCEPGDAAEERNARARAGWAGWVAGLIADCGITGLIMDGIGELDPAPYAALTGVPAWELMRIEPRIDELVELGATATEILQAVDDVIAAAAGRGAVGLKTVLAYRTGLAVDPAADLAAADRSLREDLPVPRRAKPLRDLIFRRVLGRCADLRLPLQVHSGYGDSDLRLGLANPLLLEDVLHTPEGTAATVVLIHGAFPWPDEIAYLAAVRPNVYAEISLSPLFSPARTADRLLRLFDTAPGARLLAGTDGHGHPETHWFAAHVLRDAVHRVKHELREAGARDSWLDQQCSGLLADNALRVYRLDPSEH
jgi:uncharacterized protein